MMEPFRRHQINLGIKWSISGSPLVNLGILEQILGAHGVQEVKLAYAANQIRLSTDVQVQRCTDKKIIS